MRSGKSIFYKGFIFVASVFATVFFAFTKVEAACQVSFIGQELEESYDEQYLTLAGNLDKWSDYGLQISSECSGIKIDKVSVNGRELTDGRKAFVPKEYAPGHYTVKYDYTYNEEGSSKTGSIYRYVRILDSKSGYDLGNNYSLGAYDFVGETSIIKSFYIEDNKFINFVVNQEDSNTTRSYILITDALGRNIKQSTALSYETNTNLEIVDVIRDGNDYHMVGNLINGDTKQGVVLSYLVDNSLNMIPSASKTWKSDSMVYNSGYLYESSLYVVGKTLTNKPSVDKDGASLHTYNGVGEYRGVSVVDGKVYLVGYISSDSNTLIKGLYTYITPENTPTGISLTNVIGGSDTKFNDIVHDGVNNIIVGETNIGQITASNGTIAATNSNPGFLSGFVLQVSKDGLTIYSAYIHERQDTTFTKIENNNGSFSVIGQVTEGSQGLAYSLNVLDAELEMNQEVLSSNSGYVLNGVVAWDNGYAYYGRIKSNAIQGVYYPRLIDDNGDALFIVLDNRQLENSQNLNFKLGDEYKYADYCVKYGSQPFCSEDYKVDNNGKYELVEDTTILATYAIPTSTGGVILLYREFTVVKTLPPPNLVNYTTGILKWYSYNRVYTYLNNGIDRVDTTDFDYRITYNNNTNVTIEDMIEAYFTTGNTNGYRFQSTKANSTYNSTVQNTAAFASVEYARRFAYYQEFSRVVKLSNYQVNTSANAYVGYAPEVGSDYYVYYIDFKGKASGDATQCRVSSTTISNCTSRGGYAFKDLNGIKEVIESLLKYNNYFISVKNTIYDGRVPESKGAYYESLTTKQYTNEYQKNNNLKFNSYANTTFNVEKEGSLPLSIENKIVYFGGEVDSNDNFYYKDTKITAQKKTAVVEGETFTYFENNTSVYLYENACYKVYYSNPNGQTGNPREFCLDNKAPEIVYRKTGFVSANVQTDKGKGTLASDPLYVEKDFKILGLNDLDGYAFFYANGNRYPITCSNNSPTCLKDVERYIRQEFKYDEDNPNRIRSITFSDRLSNKITFYFVIGTNTPTITIANQTETGGFTLVLDFYNSNPITSFDSMVYAQSCSVIVDGCYDPNATDAQNRELYTNDNPITESLTEFKNVVQNYIYAVAHRDQGKIEEIITIKPDEEGVYIIPTKVASGNKSIKYKIIDGYLTEVDGYQEVITMEDNMFTYNGIIFAYNELSSSIHQMICTEEECIVDTSKETITVTNGIFKFDEYSKEYEVVSTTLNPGSESEQTVIKVQVLPLKHRISENKVSLEDGSGIEYTIDPETLIITHPNPNVAARMRIELQFNRTIVSYSNSEYTFSGGVDIPKTAPICAKDVVCTPENALTNKSGLPQYKFVDGSTHYELVDGIYRFTIGQAFIPIAISKEATINIQKASVDVGVHLNQWGDDGENDPLAYKTNVLFKFPTVDEEQTDNETEISIRRLDDRDTYAFTDHVPESNFSNYSNTYYVRQTVYAAIQQKSNSYAVSVIKVYDKNEYGLPDAYNPTCNAIVIYSQKYIGMDEDDLPKSGCGSEDIIVYENSAPVFNGFQDSPTYRLWVEQFGVSAVTSSGNSFAFFGDNKFYNFTVYNYDLTEEGYTAFTSSFYIDTKVPDNNTISAKVYDGNTDSNVTSANFASVDGGYELNKIIGARNNVEFTFNWYDPTTPDFKENKMLVMKINGETPATCNVYQLMQELTQVNIGYDTECTNFVDREETQRRSDLAGRLVLVFSTSGVYDITFVDASRNEVNYKFSIDKTAPVIRLDSAYVNGGQTLTWELDDRQNIYTINSFVKNPEFMLSMEDLSEISSWSFAFFTDDQLLELGLDLNNEITKLAKLVITGDVQFRVSLSSYFIDDLQITLEKYIKDNKLDTNVTLYIWGSDNLGNGTIENAIRVRFWVDYKPPVTQVEKENLNDSIEFVKENATEELIAQTIAIRGEEYSGQVITQCISQFMFNDIRGAATAYKFRIYNCLDEHDSSGRYSENFQNDVYLKFYADEQKTKEFEFIPKFPQQTQWIYITIIDMVGNESDIIVALPIIVEDSKAPAVLDRIAWKEVGVDEYELLPAATYRLDIGDYNSNSLVFLANSNIKVVFDERIMGLYTCRAYLNGIVLPYEEFCDGYAQAHTYRYTDNVNELLFEHNVADSTLIVAFTVLDFAGNGKESLPVYIVIDRTSPDVAFKGDRYLNLYMEYMSSPTMSGTSTGYDGNYSYTLDVLPTDDQTYAPVTVKVVYSRYKPLVTYKNYKKVGSEYVMVNDGVARGTAKHYVLLNKDSVENKVCLATTVIDDITYCYVEDIASYYYFGELKTQDPDNRYYWETVSRITTEQLGVYRIAFTVTDNAGNVSKYTIYKNLFITDRTNPDININKHNTDTVLYSNVTTDSDFNGKLNTSVSFVGTDGLGGSKDPAMGRKTKFVIYMCELEKYKNATCNIDQPLYSDDPNVYKGDSFNNVYHMGKNLTEGIYKVFVYDGGQYTTKENQIYHNTSVVASKVYILTHNTSSFYFALSKKDDVSANYTIYGNNYGGGHGANGYSYVYSDINYYKAAGTYDTYLMRCSDSVNDNCSLINDTKAIGYAGKTKGTILGNTYVIEYYDNNNRVIYKVTYGKHNGTELMLHETYYKISFEPSTGAFYDLAVCTVRNNVNNCQGSDNVYQMDSMESYIYETGEYYLGVSDAYGNISKHKAHFIVDNDEYSANKDSVGATGVNYWYSVPSEVITQNNYNMFSQLTSLNANSEYNALDSRYINNFNSEFFYAFATKYDALKYVENIYGNYIEENKNSGFKIYNIDGSVIKDCAIGATNCSLTDKQIGDLIEKLVIKTFVGDANFGDNRIKQVAYQPSVGDSLKLNMYRYVYLLISETISGGVVSRDYQAVLSCPVLQENQTCIQVPLKIVNSTNHQLNNIIKETDGVNKIKCESINAQGSDCKNFSGVIPNGAIYVYIDYDATNNPHKYHTNFTYYGVTSYSYVADIEFKSIGEYVPVGEGYLQRYTLVEDDYIADSNGEYVWLNSTWKYFEELKRTSLYKDTCEFNGSTHTNGCIFVTYASKYKLVGSDYYPDDEGTYYYDYNGNYLEVADWMESKDLYVNTKSDQDIIVGAYSDLYNVPFEITSIGANSSTGKITFSTSKKSFIELFNYTTYNINNNFFDIVIAADVNEVYSYATLKIDGIYYNINKFIYGNVSNYRCILDIEIGKSYTIEITNRAGNTFTLEVSHNDIIPDLRYSLEDPISTSSAAIISVYEWHDRENLFTGDIKIQKYNFNSGKFEDAVPNAFCYTISTQQNPYQVKFNYFEGKECHGVYRVIATNSYGNSSYLDFVFNPYKADNLYLSHPDTTEYAHQKEIGEGEDKQVLNSVIYNKGVYFIVDSKLYDVTIRKYAPYTAFDTTSILHEGVIDFNQSTYQIGSGCYLNLISGSDGKHTVDMVSSSNSGCDGVYEVLITNKFAKYLANNSLFTNLAGYRSPESIEYLIRTGDNHATRIEIDTTAPDVAPIPPENPEDELLNMFFTLKIDNNENPDKANTQKLLLSETRQIQYVNKFITIVWGGGNNLNRYSYAFLKYRVSTLEETGTPTWIYEKGNVAYNYGESDPMPSKHFEIVEPGTHKIEFAFEDAVGNVENIYTIILVIEAPNVGFFMVNDDGTVIGDQNHIYEKNARIADRTILRCGVSEDGGLVRYTACTTSMYSYSMAINGIPVGFNNNIALQDYISRTSPWLPLTITQQEELHISLVVSVIGKSAIKTELSIVIDNKPPKIKIDGNIIGSTYTGPVTISLVNDNYATPDDTSDRAHIYKCDFINDDGYCMVYVDKQLMFGTGELVATIDDSSYQTQLSSYHSGYYSVWAFDNLGNASTDWFVVDNKAPTVAITTEDGKVVAHNMYTNSKAVYVTVNDELSSSSASFDVQFTPFKEGDTLGEYINSVGFNKEGKYVITPKDGVGILGRPITFYIYRQKPVYTITTNQDKDAHIVNTEATLSWKLSDNPLVAPIVSVLMNGTMYEATYNIKDKIYTGKKVTDIGDHTFVITDAAGNIAITMITINNTTKVCLNGIPVDVKMQAYYNIDELFIGGEKGVTYAKDDVIIFALPSQLGKDGMCGGEKLLSYNTLDPANSHYLIETDKMADSFNKTSGYNFVNYGFISKEAINEVKKVGGTVVVFVVSKDIANGQLGYSVGTNFFMKDPVGWTMIFVTALLMVWPTCRIFIKKKVRII